MGHVFRELRLSFAAALIVPALLGSGCGRNDSPRQQPARGPQGPVTFNRDIAPIVFNHCVPCHRPTQSGPFHLLTYADVKKRVKEIAQVTSERSMPPWLLESALGEFHEDRRLSDEQIHLIQAWVAGGALEGSPADFPPAPRWPDGWQFGEPDLVLKLPNPYALPESGQDVWRTFVIPAPLQVTRYVRTLEFQPGNKCVHHATMRLDRTPESRRKDESEPGPGFGGITFPDTARPPAGHMLNWLPGRSAYQSPPGLAWPFEGGADFLVQLHMQTTGKPEMVQPAVGLYFTDQPPTNHLSVFCLRVRTIDIPAGEAAYTIRDSYKLPVDVQVRWFNPHAHYLCKEMKGHLLLPDGTQKPLFRIPQWDFNWQSDYSFRTPLLLPKGTEVSMEYTYDNSDANPHNPNRPPRRVQYGQQSTDEMGELWIQVLTRAPKERAALERDLQLKTLAEFSDYYEHRLRLDPVDASAHCRLGIVKASLGKRDEAIQLFRRAIELDPKADEPHLHLGMLCLSQRSYAPAQFEFEAVLRLNPNNALAHGNLGLLHMNQGQLAAAETHLRTALRLNPDDAVAQENLKRVLDALGAARR